MASILEAFAGIKDTRKSQGGSYKLPCVLAAILLARLCGCSSLRDIAAWIEGAKPQLNEHLGFNWTRTPKKSGLSAILKTVCPHALAKALAEASRSTLAPIHADGKALRGEAAMALSIFDSLSQECLARVAFEEGREAECLAAWISSGAAGSRMVTADAAHIQKKLFKRPRTAAAG